MRVGGALADYGDPADLRPADLVGTWSNVDGGNLVFTADGRFTAVKLPYERFRDFLSHDFAGQVDGSGTWKLRSSQTGGPMNKVDLDFGQLADEPEARVGDSVDALVQDGKTYLVFFFVGDGGNSWRAYAKTPAPSGGGGGG
ncbi:hypothetical protein Cs7R123_33050 [Catellatospora sp. TT07R-123]|uniref:hypothetical protein n=1 Tax=Catellatospora sp. TT07R-123 TaxID=2733863 RepID=UPI001B0ACE60|nr:hypothetical protein [Catellatospora sp. TT07R-123]GHJ45963.1 hypothetical protein Cs7R123_33050 [Catellatospora sp. TT07R-123]